MIRLPKVQILSEVELENQRVLLRTDLDAGVGKNGEILDDYRIQLAVPTIRALREAGARVIVASRFGEFRTGLGTGVEGVQAPSIEPAAARLSELLGMDVLLPDGCTGDAVKRVVTSLREGQICVLENLCLEEETGPGREALARQLMSHADMYVGDSLRALSLESASSTILPRLMEKRVAGLALAQELDSIARVRSQADKPRLLIWGGGNLSARLPLLRQLLVDGTRVFLVGVAAHTMLAARGGRLGRSKVEDSYLAGARTLDAQLGERLLVPSDHMVGTSAQEPSPRSALADAVPDDCLALDLGPQTLAALQTEIARAGLVLWCGAPGLYREESFARGTRALVEMLGAAAAFTVAAGDDTVTAARFVAPETLKRLDYLADGGDAALTLLNENRLPGLEAIRGPSP